jgi:hypothetical protein
LHDHFSCSVASLDPDCSRPVTCAQHPAKGAELVINLATAKVLGLNIPWLRADKLIEYDPLQRCMSPLLPKADIPSCNAHVRF